MTKQVVGLCKNSCGKKATRRDGFCSQSCCATSRNLERWEKLSDEERSKWILAHMSDPASIEKRRHKVSATKKGDPKIREIAIRACSIRLEKQKLMSPEDIAILNKKKGQGSINFFSGDPTKIELRNARLSKSVEKSWKDMPVDKREQRIKRALVHGKNIVVELTSKKLFKVRSNFEKDFSFLLFDSDIKFEYEPFQIGYDESRMYSPDFYLPAYNLIVELKGAWFMNKENLLAKAQGVINQGYNFVIVWFKDFYANPQPSLSELLKTKLDRKVQRLEGEQGVAINLDSIPHTVNSMKR